MTKGLAWPATLVGAATAAEGGLRAIRNASGIAALQRIRFRNRALLVVEFGAILGPLKLPVSRNQGHDSLKKDTAIKSLQQRITEIDAANWQVRCSATDYPRDQHIAAHSHNKHQLIYAIEGVMVVRSKLGQWTVPPSRGLWMPSGETHEVRCIGPVKMRSVFVRPDGLTSLPAAPRVVGISALLSELIKTSVHIAEPYSEDSREARVMGLMLDELKLLPTLPLHLPQPTDTRIALICSTLQANPGDGSTLSDWSTRLNLDEKTIQRLFRTSTGMTFGQWRQQARLLLALERIAGGEKIIDIAGDLGYESPSAFTTMFKKHFGTTPSQFFR